MTNVLDVLETNFVEIDIKQFSSNCSKDLRKTFVERLTPKQVELTIKILNLRSQVYYKDIACLMQVPVKVIQYIVKSFEEWLKKEYNYDINEDSSVLTIHCSCDQLVFYRGENGRTTSNISG